MAGIKLGATNIYESQYNPNLLAPIARSESRAGLPAITFTGCDIWTAYELSWLAPGGKPQVAVAEFTVPADSEFIIESKSFKYYLNSFNQTPFASADAVSALLKEDLSHAAGGAVDVRLYSLPEFHQARGQTPLNDQCLDELEPTRIAYSPDAALLVPQPSDGGVFVSHLLKSNCPVTGQPDWASVWFGVEGAGVAPESLLAYVISFREHQDFHEHCVERMYADLMQTLQPDELWVYARYTRRGGLDINPFRASKEMSVPYVAAARQ